MESFLDTFSKFISCFAFAGMVIIVLLNIFVRAFLSSSLLFTEELSYLFFFYSVFFGVCVVYKHIGLISIDIIVEKLPSLARKIILTFTTSLLLAVNLILFWYSCELSISSWSSVSPSLGIPYFFFYLSATIAFLILAYYSLLFLIKNIRGEELGETSLE